MTETRWKEERESECSRARCNYDSCQKFFPSVKNHQLCTIHLPQSTPLMPHPSISQTAEPGHDIAVSSRVATATEVPTVFAYHPDLRTRRGCRRGLVTMSQSESVKRQVKTGHRTTLSNTSLQLCAAAGACSAVSPRVCCSRPIGR